jgi:hypothetical protein
MVGAASAVTAIRVLAANTPDRRSWRVDAPPGVSSSASTKACFCTPTRLLSGFLTAEEIVTAIRAVSATDCGTPATGNCSCFPADVIDRRSWKVTLPIRDSDKVLEVKRVRAGHLQARFVLLGQRRQDRHPVSGVAPRGTTANRRILAASFVRCARMATRRKLSIADGTRSMEVRGGVNRLTKVKPHVVIGQIHGGSDDVTVWRVEGKKLFITKGDDSHAHNGGR